MKLINRNILFSYFLLTFFLKLILLSIIVPIWHTPDEQAHFAQVAYFAEYNKMPGSNFDLNQEIYLSEDLLGTLRDERGVNKYTYHPEFNIEYTESYTGKYEQTIREIPIDDRKKMVKQEAAQYPPLYYWIAAIPYKLFYSKDLIDRVYFSRFVSMLMGAGLVFISYLLAKNIFPKDKLLQITLPVLIAFHPMLSFVSVGVSSDNLLNLLFSVLIYFGVLIINKGLKLKLIIGMLITLVLLYLTKPQFVLGITVIILSIIISVLVNFKISRLIKCNVISVSLLMGVILVFLFTNQQILHFIENIYPQRFFSGFPQKWSDPIEFSKMVISKTLHETIPWYFGVYKWLGVVLPIEILRIINRLLILIGLGIFIKIILSLKNRTKENAIFIFLILTSSIYFMGIVFYDYVFFSRNNFSFGLQGRYFFPTVLAHFSLILIGYKTLIPERYLILQSKLIKLLGISMIFLYLYTNYLIAKSYYDISNINFFLIQVSQYKPFIFKGYFIVVWLVLNFVLTSVLIVKYLRIPFSKQVEN